MIISCEKEARKFIVKILEEKIQRGDFKEQLNSQKWNMKMKTTESANFTSLQFALYWEGMKYQKSILSI